MSVADKLQIVAPEFNGADNSGMIDIAELQVATNLCGGGERRDLIVAYLAAHMLTIANRKLGAAGEIKTMSEGRISIAYENGTTDRAGLSSTSYGREYMRLISSCIFSMTIRNNSIC